VATRAAARTGVSGDILKRMLPIAAAMMMGAMARNSGGAANAGLSGGGGGGLADMLTPMLDSNRNGSIIDDVTGVLGRMFGR
jgi:hypothetical protein